jgi:hypothetical protein
MTSFVVPEALEFGRLECSSCNAELDAFDVNGKFDKRASRNCELSGFTVLVVAPAFPKGVHSIATIAENETKGNNARLPLREHQRERPTDVRCGFLPLDISRPVYDNETRWATLEGLPMNSKK